MKTIRPIGLLCAISAFGLISACASMNQSLKVAPLEMQKPVSASSSLLVDGKVIAEQQLSPVRDFQFEKFFSAKLTQKELELNLGEDLSRIMEESDADGIIKLRVEVERIDTSAVGWIATERYGGLLLAGTGLIMIGVSSAVPDSQNYVVASGVGIAAGALLLGGSMLHESLGTVGYYLRVAGTAVRF